MGKAYANRKPFTENDFYQTPKCLTYELLKTGLLFSKKTILDPCCGKGAISETLKKFGFSVDELDLTRGNDFLTDTYDKKYDAVVMNPPFKYWDAFVEKALTLSDLVITIGRTNYFGSKSRKWEHLQYVYIFNRQVAYDKELRADEKIHCGCLITGWFVFNKKYEGEPIIRFIDIDNYILRRKESSSLRDDLREQAKNIIEDIINNIELTDELCARVSNETYEFIKRRKNENI